MNSNNNFTMKTLSSLEKVFLDQEPVYKPECLQLSGLFNETVSYQIAYSFDGNFSEEVYIQVKSDLKEYIKIRTVENVQVIRPSMSKVDDNYLRTSPGLYPDLLKDLKDDKIYVFPNQWRSIWIDIEISKEIEPGDYDIVISFVDENGRIVSSSTMDISIIGVSLPKQTLIHTEWLHADCLADYYGLEVFSEKHWEILKNYFIQSASRGMNMILTPLFTYPLDTKVGLERTTTQLIDIEVQNGKYIFSFDKLKRWVDLCFSCGIEYIEMSHLFSQWGAEHPPKIMAEVDGKQEQIFGWDTPALGDYTTFLQAFIPKLIEVLKEWGILEKTYFHISDVPRQEHLESFKDARDSIINLLEGLKIFDATNTYNYYKEGLIDIPVASTNIIDDFIDKDIEELWTYYCVGQCYEVSNRFMSMPSLRNRIIGLQLYKFKIHGFLHWGYNFYNSFLSTEKLNPYEVTDSNGNFPSGDAFLVYPGPSGHPEESIRLMVLNQALQDMRALRLLEDLTSRDEVLDLIDGKLVEPLTFKTYPKSEMYLINLREEVNQRIKLKLGEFLP